MPLNTGTEGKGTGGNCRLAPLLAMIGAGLPWVAYDRLIADSADFWTFRGAVFIAIALLGMLSVALAWDICRREREKHKSGGQERTQM